MTQTYTQQEGFIIIVARDNIHLTQKACDSASAQDIPCQVILIDNGSTDGTAQWAAARSVCRISLLKQQSLSTCWNIGLKLAWQTKREHALILNNDVEIAPDTYRLLLKHGGPFVTCVSVDKPEQMGSKRSEEYDRNTMSERPHPDFSAFLIRKEVTDKVGWFDEAYYPAYCEDCDYHVRMHKAGIPAVCIDLPFLHHGAQTVKNCSMPERRKIERGAGENRERFRQKYGCLPGTPDYESLFKHEYKTTGRHEVSTEPSSDCPLSDPCTLSSAQELPSPSHAHVLQVEKSACLPDSSSPADQDGCSQSEQSHADLPLSDSPSHSLFVAQNEQSQESDQVPAWVRWDRLLERQKQERAELIEAMAREKTAQAEQAQSAGVDSVHTD